MEPEDMPEDEDEQDEDESMGFSFVSVHDHGEVEGILVDGSGSYDDRILLLLKGLFAMFDPFAKEISE